MPSRAGLPSYVRECSSILEASKTSGSPGACHHYRQQRGAPRVPRGWPQAGRAAAERAKSGGPCLPPSVLPYASGVSSGQTRSCRCPERGKPLPGLQYSCRGQGPADWPPGGSSTAIVGNDGTDRLEHEPPASPAPGNLLQAAGRECAPAGKAAPGRRLALPPAACRLSGGVVKSLQTNGRRVSRSAGQYRRASLMLDNQTEQAMRDQTKQRMRIYS